MSKAFEYISELSSADYRIEERQGRKWLVRKYTGIVEGVFKGLLMSTSQIESSIDTWNGKPIFLSHPEVKETRNPNVYDDYKLGELFYSYFEDKGLKGEAWFDIEDVERIGEKTGKDILDILKESENISVSIGFKHDIAFETGELDGKHYEGKFVDIVGDHLAILLDEPPACSTEKGCGVGIFSNLNYSQETNMARETARVPNYEGTERTTWGEVDKTLDAFREAYYNQNPDAKPENEEEIPEKVEDMPSDMKTFITNFGLMGEVDNEEFEGPNGILYFPVVNPSTYQLNYNGLMAARRAAGNADINSRQEASIMDVTARLLEDEFDEMVENKFEGFKEEIVTGVFNKIRNFLGRETMNEKEKLIQELKGCEFCTVDKETLDNLDENYVEVLKAVYETNKQLITETEFSQDKDKEENEKSEMEEFLENNNIDTDKAIEILDEQITEKEEEKQELIEELSDSGFTEEELEDFSIETLGKIADKSSEGNYKGRKAKTDYGDSVKTRTNKQSYTEYKQSKGE